MSFNHKLCPLRASFCTRIVAFLVTLAATASLLAQVPDNFNPGADDEVDALAIQPDGKILVGGWFANLGGQPRDYLGRVDAEGVLDTNFTAQTDGPVYSFAVQPDGKIIVGGWFSELGGGWRDFLGRLNPDGSLDTTFTNGANSTVYGLALQADGKIVVAGNFTRLGGIARPRLARLDANGTVEGTFRIAADDTVYCVAVQPDGKILVGGVFTSLGYAGGVYPPAPQRNHLGRFNSDGTVDETFNPNVNGPVYSLSVQPNGRILLGGSFTVVGGQNHTNVARVHADGTPDGTFIGGANGYVNSIALQANGKVFVAGGFTSLLRSSSAWVSNPGVGRLNPNGLLEQSSPYFNSYSPGLPVLALALQEDGRVLAGGVFAWSYSSGGLFRTNIARLTNEVATRSLRFDGATVTWSCSGSSPEFWRTTFELSTNRTEWVYAGAGTRITGGWQLSGLSAPSNTLVRARGWVAGGGTSVWFVEALAAPPSIPSQPVSRTNNAGTVANFAVQAGGIGPFSYQWLHDGGNVSGATNSTLSLTNVLGADAGGYSVVISNIYGASTSRVAVLQVLDPLIYGQPLSQSVGRDQTAVFTVSALGTEPLNYQWRKSGVAVADATQATLTLTNSQLADAGTYDVIITNMFGSVTSSPVTLGVNVVAPDAFNPSPSGWQGSSLPPNASSPQGGIAALAIEKDGMILIGGSFTSVGGQGWRYIAHLAADGTPASGYSGGANRPVQCFNAQTDGLTAVAGGGWWLGGSYNGNLVWLNPDGSLKRGIAADGLVYALAGEWDDQLVAGGVFSFSFWTDGRRLARISSSAGLDETFNPTANNAVFSAAQQPDGKILVGGAFETLNGEARTYLGRLNHDGTLDTNFVQAATNSVYAIALQADGKILAGGESALARFNPDGTRDTNFNVAVSGPVYSVVVQADGRILVGGQFTNLAGQARTNLGRLYPAGEVDPTFVTSADAPVYALALQADGKLLVGGTFARLGGAARSYVGRLYNTEPATQSLALDGSSITWLRGGTGPEVWRVAFESSTDGTTWVNSGAGVRIPGGWRLDDPVLATNSTIRARGFVTGGLCNGSSWFVESAIAVNPGLPPRLVLGPGSTGDTNHFGFHFQVKGLTGQVVVVEGSTNCADWIPLETITLAGESSHFSDPDSVILPRRFYRARLQEGAGGE
jgi:uncharacterized delta-60 repeat protein